MMEIDKAFPAHGGNATPGVGVSLDSSPVKLSPPPPAAPATVSSVPRQTTYVTPVVTSQYSAPTSTIYLQPTTNHTAPQPNHVGGAQALPQAIKFVRSEWGPAHHGTGQVSVNYAPGASAPGAAIGAQFYRSATPVRPMTLTATTINSSPSHRVALVAHAPAAGQANRTIVVMPNITTGCASVVGSGGDPTTGMVKRIKVDHSE